MTVANGCSPNEASNAAEAAKRVEVEITRMQGRPQAAGPAGAPPDWIGYHKKYGYYFNPETGYYFGVDPGSPEPPEPPPTEPRVDHKHDPYAGPPRDEHDEPFMTAQWLDEMIKRMYNRQGVEEPQGPPPEPPRGSHVPPRSLIDEQQVRIIVDLILRDT
jgi:hypothetical protein